MTSGTSDGVNIFTIGPAMQIRFQQSDLASLETHPLTPGLKPSEFDSVSVTAAAVTGATAVTAKAGFTPITTPTATPLTRAPNSTLIIAETSSPSATNVLPSTQADVPGTGLASQDALRPGLIAVVVLAVIATICAMCFVLWTMKRSGELCWKGSRDRRRSGAAQEVGLGVWIGRRPIHDEGRSRDRMPRPIQTQNNSIDRDHGVMSPVDILDFEKSLGTRQNPAELEANEAQRLSQRLSQRASWVSRMLSKVARSSISTRSSSRSRWTQRSLAHTGDWEVIPVYEKTGRADEDVGRWTILGTTDPRPTAMISCPGDDGKYDEKSFVSLGAHLDLPPKVRNFDRLSQGTFGRVIVRRRSFDSPYGSGHT